MLWNVLVLVIDFCRMLLLLHTVAVTFSVVIAVSGVKTVAVSNRMSMY
jgi:hypothetical protein